LHLLDRRRFLLSLVRREITEPTPTRQRTTFARRTGERERLDAIQGDPRLEVLEPDTQTRAEP